MTREEAIKTLTEPPDIAELAKQVETLTNLVRFMAENMVLQQKEVCEQNGISPNTVIKMVEEGKVELLQADGSRLKFFTALTAKEDLKPRRRLKQS